MWHRFRSCPNLKPMPKFVLRLYSVHCARMFFIHVRLERYEKTPNRIQQALNIYACCRMRILRRWFMHLSYVPHCWKGAPHCLHNTQASSLSASLSVCVCACKFIDMGLNLIWTVAPIRDAHTCNNCNILFTLAASLSFVLVRNILIASQSFSKKMLGLIAIYKLLSYILLNLSLVSGLLLLSVTLFNILS